MKTQPLLDLRMLRRDYVRRPFFGTPQVTRALNDLSLTVERGTIHGIVGESGCGKSTLARIVMALDQPTSGDVIFDGEELFRLKEEELRRKRRDFQMVFQDPFGSLDPRQSVEQILAEPLHVLEKPLKRSEIRDRVVALLEAVGLNAGQAKLRPHQFSGGQRQRIAIARALMTEPKLVVADEAVSALDLSVQAQVLNLLLDLKEQRGVTFLFITHNLAVVDCVADHVSVMYRGRLVESGPAQAVFQSPLHPYTRLLAESEPDISRFGGRSAPAARHAPADTSLGCAFRDRCPLAIPRCAVEPPALRVLQPSRLSACHRAEMLLPSSPNLSSPA
ncbi:oligopeptide/dipeptide ABC transporter ATP-binding protein [Rhizobium paknamense]|uniref:Peptide/nickel transport system ATP-binding protein n=1 Tax=Rhizobium paknamense TaxID=1206817 RepID=A0ABU0IG53_9HYPH|nr:oligopeptide/dipeptide ABC transporter ATP-binding protein [Rhizobium paknamense]MDQ0457229.1 peptide/nickel transport system ATP-binding protein [Rhizobium paknamense]